MRASRALRGLTVVLLLAMTSIRADADPQTFESTTIKFECEIIIAFPAPAPNTPSKTNCHGDHIGAIVGGPKGTKATNNGTANGDVINKGENGNGNFFLYNVKYTTTCQPGAPVPLLASASGDFIFIYDKTGNPGTLTEHGQFELAAGGNGWVAFLSNVHVHNGTEQKGHKTGSGNGVGQAAGIFEFKQPLGTCDAPNPQQVLNVRSVGKFTIKPA